MPRFKIRTDNGDGPDDTGDSIEFPHEKAAREDAQKALAEMARDRMPLDRDTHFSVEVENEAGRRIYKGSLDLSENKEPTEPDSAKTDVSCQQRSRPRE